MSSSKIIQNEDLTAYQRWELPSVDETASEQDVAQVLEPEIRLPTVEDLQRIQKEAHDEAYKAGFEEGKLAGHKEGLEEGRNEGRQLGIVDGQKEIEEKGNKIMALFSLMTSPLDDLDEIVEHELVSLAIAVTKQLVRRELKIDSGQIVASVRHGVAALPVATRNVRVFLHPEDAALVREAMAIGDSNEEARWRIIEDAALTRGGCHIESDESRIDATVESRLARIIALALGGEREGER